MRRRGCVTAKLLASMMAKSGKERERERGGYSIRQEEGYSVKTLGGWKGYVNFEGVPV